jgi:DNA-binding SARP family transcriptional activator/tetratricopeptide (TPR) repeat protein
MPQPASDSVQKQNSIQIRLLGDLAVMRSGKAVCLPASKRSRALLGYLVGTASAQTRQALCDLLWDGPDDPRAELRWSLTKLRPVVDEPATRRIAADRERVVFVPHGAIVDTGEVRTLLSGGIETAPVAVLEQAAALLAGEFLDGLDLPACYRFHQWCMAERESYSALRIKVISALIDRLADEPERALTYARAMVTADPLSEPAHAALIRLLVAVGRLRDAEAHGRYTESMFQRELGLMPGNALRDALRQLRDMLRHRPRHAMAEISPPEPLADAPNPLVGRTAERSVIDAAITSLAEPGQRSLLLFVGEPGIGKTRLLEVLAEHARQTGCRVLFARCFEAEIMRPYGGWIDALRALPPALIPDALRRDLGPLLPASDIAAVEQGDRTHLFAATAKLIRHLAAEQPLVLILDDLQWLDEGSSALLHYLERSADPATRLLIAGAARQDEIDDNPWAKGLVHSLARDRRLHQCALDPLGAEDVARLLVPTAPAADAQAVHRKSGGNPLFVLALAHAGAAGDAAEELSWQALTTDRVQRLDENCRELIVWAAAMGREFRLEMLSAAMSLAETELMMRLDRLERRGLLVPTGEGHYDFAHDLVREAVYRGLSHPRRRAIHRQIARAIEATAILDTSLYGELVHHASQAGDAALTVRACIAAAEHCLRVFANAQAVTAAERGLAMLEQLAAGAERVNAHIALLKLRIVAAADPRAARVPELMEQLQKAIEAAEWMGLHSTAATGLHMLSWLTLQANDTESTRLATLRAERMSRTTDAATHCQQLANTGRCLLEVEADVPQARALIDAATAQADAMNLHIIELQWGRGLLARWDGDLASAASALQSAVELARLREDRWRELDCLVWLATIELEHGHFDAVDILCQELARVVTRMGDVKVPMTNALQAISALQRPSMCDAIPVRATLAASITELRDLDDKSHLAYILNHAAILDLDGNRLDQAESAAIEALGAAQAVGRSTDIAIAQALLACIACSRGRTEHAASHLQKGRSTDHGVMFLSARALSFLAQAERAMSHGKVPAARGRRIPTPLPTKAT